MVPMFAVLRADFRASNSMKPAQATVASLERRLERHGDETERLHQIIAGLAQANAEQARTTRAIEAPASEEPAEDAETVE